MAANTDRTVMREFLGLLMKPLVRFCFRHSLSIQDFINVAKVVFIETAEEEIRKSTAKINPSRLSVMTGLHRKDVTRIYKKKEFPTEDATSELWRIIGHWEQSHRFTTRAGKPAVLTYRGPNNEFRALVTEVTKHTDPGTILFELERIGMIEKSERGVKLIQPLQRIGTDKRRGFELLSHDIDMLLCAVEENLLNYRGISNLHVSTLYDNIFEKDLPKIRRWLLNEGKEFHRRAREFIAKFDADITPDIEQSGPAGAKVAVGSFSFTPTFPKEFSKDSDREDL